MHNMRSQLLNVSYQPSFETEDEDTLPHRASHMYTSPTVSVDLNDGEEHQNPILANSFERLAKNAASSTSQQETAAAAAVDGESKERSSDENYFMISSKYIHVSHKHCIIS